MVSLVEPEKKERNQTETDPAAGRARNRQLTWRSLVRDLVGQLGAQHAEALDDASLDPFLEAFDPVESFGQFVGVAVHLGAGQVGGAETAEQQGQEEVQHLQRGKEEVDESVALGC